MEKTVLNEAFELLKELKAVSSESAFSKDWLGRSECYLRTLRFHGGKPSLATIAVCASRLQHYGQQLAKLVNYRDAGQRLLALSQKCHAQVNARKHGDLARIFEVRAPL